MFKELDYTQWGYVKLGEVADFITGKLDSNQENLNGSYPFFTCAPKPSKINSYAFNSEAILLAGNNANGIFHVNYYNGKFNAYQRTYVITSKDNNILNLKFLYYQLYLVLNVLKNISQGTATKFLTMRILNNLEILLPPIEEQRKISNILWSLEDKISINNKINTTFEAISQAIFKHWFIDFEFPNDEGKPYKSSGGEMEETELGEVPVGWKVGKIADLCISINNGGTPKRMESRYWKDGTIPWYKTGELLDGPLLDSEEHITEDGLNESSCHLWDNNTILIALYASPTVGRLGLLKKPGASNQACSGLMAKPDVGYAFLFYFLLSKRDELNMVAVGSAQQNISQQIVKDQTIIIPPSNITSKFQNSIEVLFDLTTSNLMQSYTLTAIRDALLPKLMSGEIRVNHN